MSVAAEGRGPHGGLLVPLVSGGSVEMSVFETGVPPRFRLYFLDMDRRIGEPRSARDVEVDTIRPDGTRQPFTFTETPDYLESTSEIPEPHEFEVMVRITDGDQAHTYRTTFTEAAHGHGDEAGHAHGHDHGDDHGGGILGRVRGMFGHSHAAEDKIDASMESNARGIQALKIGLIGLLLTATFQLTIVIVSGSVGLLADTIHNFGDAGTSIPLWIAFSLTARGASRRFTYGYGKTEDVAGVVIILIIFFSACVAAWESVRKILHPQPVTHLWWAAAAAIVGFIGNEAVAVFRIRVGTEIGSAALVADGQHARIDGLTSLAVLIGLLGVRFGFPILDPLIGIVITVAILFIVRDTTKTIWTRLVDGIEPEILAEIEHAPMHIAGVRSVADVRARWIGHRVYSDLAIGVDPRLSVAEADAIAKRVERSLTEHIRLLGGVVVRVAPMAAGSLATGS